MMGNKLSGHSLQLTFWIPLLQFLMIPLASARAIEISSVGRNPSSIKRKKGMQVWSKYTPLRNPIYQEEEGEVGVVVPPQGPHRTRA